MLQIKTELDENTLEAFKNLLLRIDPKAQIVDNRDYELSEADEKALHETLKAYQNGSLKSIPAQQFWEQTDEHLRGLGAKI